VGTSPRHSLALTTEPGATAAELLTFAGDVVAAVEQRFGVRLEQEPTAVDPRRAEWAPEGSAPA
jgi:UDP-N-acetylmuramate dehydrogenase